MTTFDYQKQDLTLARQLELFELQVAVVATAEALPHTVEPLYALGRRRELDAARAALHARLEQQAEELVRLREALEWYGDLRNWDQGIDRAGYPQDSDAQDDEGAKARAALAQKQEGGAS